MYLDHTVEIPSGVNGISKKSHSSGTTYVYFIYDRVYIPEKRFTKPVGKIIGKCDPEDPDRMYPNENYRRFFPDAAIEAESGEDISGISNRSACLRMGAYTVIKKLMHDLHIDEMIERIIGRDSGLFLDLAAYSLIEEDNAGQYYPDYAYSHPLFTEGMHVYSDSKISDFLRDITIEQRVRFLNEWNAVRDHREKIYITYDSTNKHCQAGDIELAEIGYEKDKQNKPVFNYSIAYDTNNMMPLFYESYPGSIVDVSQLQYMLEKAKGYGYKKAGFILDRGYFSKGNIRYMDKCGYDFVMMVKGMKDLVSDLVLRNHGRFEQDRAFSIRRHKVSGMTVKSSLFEGDDRERYFHIYYNGSKAVAERENFEQKIDRIARSLKEQEGKKYRPTKEIEKYFDPIYYHEGQEDEVFDRARERKDVINREIKQCGYFVIITSARMDASEALDLYKSRDVSEKLFRGDKSYLGNKSERVYTDEAAESKIFIEFIALIVRNSIYTRLKNKMEEDQKKQNYMTVPAAIKELEKIEMIRYTDMGYGLDHAITATQKTILEAFGMAENDITREVKAINKTLRNSDNRRAA